VRTYAATVHGRAPDLSSGERRWRALLAVLLGSAFGLLSCLDLESFPSCTFHDLTGYSCLTCGLTRSLLALAQGHLAASIGHHLMGPVLFLGICWAVVYAAAESLTGRKLFPAAWAVKVPLLWVALLWITYGAVRLASELAR
jgi:hypothetical protein